MLVGVDASLPGMLARGVRWMPGEETESEIKHISHIPLHKDRDEHLGGT